MDVPTIPARSIVIKNKSTAWFGTRYTMNIYRGCSHGCIYCDSRSECYGVQDFDTVRVKSDALAVIRNDLRSKTQSGVVTTGGKAVTAMSSDENRCSAHVFPPAIRRFQMEL